MSVKKLKIQYGDSFFSLPREKVLLTLPSAGSFELKVLMLLASDEGLRSDYDSAVKRLCKLLDCTESALLRALNFWSTAGVIEVGEGGEAVKTADPADSPKLLQASELPTYTEGQVAEIIERSTGLADIIDSAQQIVGKIFTPAEANTVVMLYDYLGLNDDGYIITLYKYCKALGKTSARYIEKMAIGMADEGITTTLALSEYIERRERVGDRVAQIRALVGAGGRSLTAKEKKQFECWACEMNFDIDVITRAYEVTVDNIGEYKIAYMNKVLENWYRDGLTTIEAVEESLGAYQKKKAEAEKAQGGFETDEYFEAALARSQKFLESNRTDPK